ncbi:MAG: hypothetical protein V1875_09140 [Candidatus Altiarchaeota archaeon]
MERLKETVTGVDALGKPKNLEFIHLVHHRAYRDKKGVLYRAVSEIHIVDEGIFSFRLRFVEELFHVVRSLRERRLERISLVYDPISPNSDFIVRNSVEMGFVSSGQRGRLRLDPLAFDRVYNSFKKKMTDRAIFCF